MGIVFDYQTWFERLLARANTLIDKQEAECLISRLKDGLRVDVRVQNPQNLSVAIGLARTYELKAQEVRRPTNPTFSSSVRNSNNQWNTSTPSGAKDTNLERILPIHKLSPTKLQRRRQQGLCYNCDEKYTMGHKYKKLFFIELEEENEEAIEEECKRDTSYLFTCLGWGSISTNYADPLIDW